MALTVVPLHNLNIPRRSRIPFAKFTIQDVPAWVDKDGILNDLALHDRTGVRQARHALVSEYEAESIGHADPDWTGQTSKSIQDLRFQSAMLANMCIWMIWPSSVCFTVGFHALARINGGDDLDVPFIAHTEREGPLYCHPRDVHNRVTPQSLIKAAKLFETLSTVGRKNAVDRKSVV